MLTLYKIKTAIKGSGRKIVLIKEILNEDPNIKVEEYFKESVVEKNHELTWCTIGIIKILVFLPVPILHGWLKILYFNGSNNKKY